MTVNKSQRTADGDFKGGFSGNPKGRPKGAKDKISKNIKENFDAVFEKLGGVDGFFKWAEKNFHTQTVFYQMYSKMLPTNITADLLPNTDNELIVKVVHIKSKDENKIK